MVGDDLRIVPAPRALKPRILELTRRTFDEHRARQPYSFPKNSCKLTVEPNIDRAFQDENGREIAESRTLFVAMQGDELAGYVMLSNWAQRAPQDVPYVSIDDICVVPEHRRHGIARALLQHVKTLADSADWDSLNASIWAGNDASEALFRSEGFVPEMLRLRYGPDRQARNFPEADMTSPAAGFWRDFSLVVCTIAATAWGLAMLNWWLGG